MEDRGYKENLKKVILDMTQKELQNYMSQKTALNFFEGNIDTVINESIKKMSEGFVTNKVYSRVLKKSSYQDNIPSILKIIRSEDSLKNKNELIKFAKHLNIKVTSKQSYKIISRRIANHIYSNRENYSRKYVLYEHESEEYALDPEQIKKELIERYRSKTRDDMKSIAKLLDIEVHDYDAAEDIRRKVINSIIQNKLIKK